MPYDITDAKEDIETLNGVVNYMYSILKDNDLLPKEEVPKEKLKKVE